MQERRRTFDRAVEKMKVGENEIYFYTIPGGFKDNTELLEYWRERGYQAGIINSTNGRHGILHVSW